MWQHLQKLGPKGTLAENSFIFRDPVAKSDEKFMFGEIQKKDNTQSTLLREIPRKPSTLFNCTYKLHSVKLRH